METRDTASVKGGVPTRGDASLEHCWTSRWGLFSCTGLRSVSCRLGALRGNVMGWGHGQTQVSQKTSSWLQSPVSMMRSFGVGAGESVFLVLRHLEGEYGVGKMAVTSPREESLAEKCCLLGRKAMNYFTNCNSLEMLVNNLYPG